MVCCDHLCLSFASHAWCDSTRLLDMAIRTHKTCIVYSVYSDHPNDSVHHCLFTQQNQAHREQFVRHNCLKCFSFILEFISIYLFFIFSSWWIWIKIKITNELELKIKLKKKQESIYSNCFMWQFHQHRTLYTIDFRTIFSNKWNEMKK